MRDATIDFLWTNRHAARRFAAGVSLHSHTLHSRECLSFISRVTGNVPYLSREIRRHEEQYRTAHEGRSIDMTRAWWTPPLCARKAWSLEKTQIEYQLGLASMVSLTDHDTIEAGTRLSICETGEAPPISVEWTVPFRRTFFHIGVHNMPRDRARQWMQAMRDFTLAKDGAPKLADLLALWNESPDTLVVWNHPLWDEKGVGAGLHWSCAREFLARFGKFLHAMELNGLRPWRENRNVVSFARIANLPVISGGDRHAREPNACLNLTNARTFPEFVEEVRRDGWSRVLFMEHYREPLKLRIIQNMCAVLREDPEHSMGWRRWSDRVFYLCDDGMERSLTELWSRGAPSVVDRFVRLMRITEERWMQSALRLALAEKEEPAL